MSFWDDFKSEAMGTIKGTWEDSKGDVSKAAADAFKNALGIKSNQPTSSPTVIWQKAATNPLTYVIVAAIAVLLYILLGRK